MAALHKSVAALRISGDSLKPDEISQILNCPPSLGYLKGQIKRGKVRDVVRKTGAWMLDAADREPGDLDAQVAELFGRLITDLSVWSSLAKQYRMDLFCGFFMKETNEGFEVSPQTMKLLADRGIKLAVCIYAPINDPNPADPCPCKSGKTYAECCAPKLKS
jgi:hypothetical protein